MRSLMRARLIAGIALVLLGTGAVAFAVTDSFPLISASKVVPHGEASPPVSAASDESADSAQGVLGTQASDPGDGGDRDKQSESKQSDREAKNCKRDKACNEEKRGDGGGDVGTEMVSALIPAGSGGGGPALPCSDTNSCVDRVGRLVTNVADRLPALPRLRDCTSFIGGKATCFHFGGGNYLVGDSPADGEGELGFCTSSGYYYVSGPSLGGGTGVACPDDPGSGDDTDRTDAPTARECASSSGGEATCFYFGRGNYLVSDPLADGGGELGFCTSSGYYYVSAPSAEGDAGAKCPDARAAD